MAMRQPQAQPSAQSVNNTPPTNDPRYAAALRQQMRAPSMHPNVAYRFPPAPYCYRGAAAHNSSFDPRFAAGQQYMLPNAPPPVSYPAPQMAPPNIPLSSISSPIPATNLMEALATNQPFSTCVTSNSSGVVQPNEPAVATREMPPNIAHGAAPDEERKKIISQEMEEARRRREAAQLGERISQTETPTSSADCSARSGSAQPSEITSTTQGSSVDQSSSQVTSSTSNSSPPPKDPAPLRSLKVTIRRCSTGGATTSLVNDPEHVASTTVSNTNGENADESKWDDYCYVCQQGCDEKTGSLGCCARCPHVYHNYCHVPPIKQPMESLPDEWACSLCMPAEPLHEDSGVMGSRERLLCSKVLLRCYEHFLQAEPFSHPVPKTVPNYYVIIKHPMDFGTIARRLRERAKDAFVSVLQFIQCMNLVFENCSTFNPGLNAKFSLAMWLHGFVDFMSFLPIGWPVSNTNGENADESKWDDYCYVCQQGCDEKTVSNTNGENADESKWDDYCYVCQQGCDEKTGSLGCCARCPHVYHNYCHVPPIKQPMESLPDEWACSLCMPAEPLHEDSGVMGSRERLLCSKVLLRCYEHFLQAEPFSHPVPKTVPNYYVIIKHPMDFGTIARRLRERAKDAFVSVLQFIQCMNLVFENCSTFNPPDDEVAQAGRSVYNLYSKAVKEFLPCMKGFVWLYINKYSEGRNNMIVQKDSGLQQVRPRSSESSSEPHAKKPRKEIKDEID
ncbi:E3 ubiquitin-protein ligase TRIM33 [Toxocara canis]|uniref:E3 ubiquitin-protein ligase TRIM33 n=1 Tax=Toxocara canis TaxID=6265 RepID=A0A0B2VEK3_TOXCA|nr:E3 ubiquitin-protein ligase TRIM33 [Toxocara canis]